MVKQVLFVQMGGTIDKDYPRSTGGWAFEIHDSCIPRIMDRILTPYSYQVVSLLKKDSQEITEEDRRSLTSLIRTSTHQAFIITHGTDTMIETAKYVHDLIPDRLIIFTGAMKPERFGDSDAHFNVGMALGAWQCLQKGVYIAMHGQVIPAVYCTRDATSGLFLATNTLT